MLFIRQPLPIAGKLQVPFMGTVYTAITCVSMCRQAAYCAKKVGSSREVQVMPSVARYGQAFSPSILARPAPSLFNGASPMRPSKEHMAGITSISYNDRQEQCGLYTCTWHY